MIASVIQTEDIVESKQGSKCSKPLKKPFCFAHRASNAVTLYLGSGLNENVYLAIPPLSVT